MAEIEIVLIQGSVRPANFTAKAAAVIADELGQRSGVHLTRIDPATLALAQPGAGSTADAARLQTLVAAATGVILVTPEYHGCFSSVMKLVIENLGFPSSLAGKPVALAGVAAGQIGAIKSLEALRSVCSHVGALVLPGAVSIAGVQQVFDDAGNCLEASTEKRLRGVAKALLDYIDGAICPRLALEAMVREQQD